MIFTTTIVVIGFATYICATVIVPYLNSPATQVDIMEFLDDFDDFMESLRVL